MPPSNKSTPGSKCSSKQALNSRGAVVVATSSSPKSLTARIPASAATPGACDCTVYCGDDPWLKDGRSEPCEHMLASIRKAAEERTRRKLLSECAARVLDHATDHDIITLAKFVQEQTS